MSFKAVIFDWDGTVVDSVEHITDCLHHAAAVTGFPTRTRAEYRNIIGLSIVEAIRRLYPGLGDLDAKRMREAYSAYFLETAASHQKLFPGIQTLIHDLVQAGKACAVATGKTRQGLNRALSDSGIATLFAVTRCADETRSKPDPLMLAEILEHLQIKPEEAVMIGDTSYDLQMAQNIGMPSIGVRWGVHPDAVLNACKPVTLVDSTDELRNLLLK